MIFDLIKTNFDSFIKNSGCLEQFRRKKLKTENKLKG